VPLYCFGIIGAMAPTCESGRRTDDVSAIFHHATWPASELASRL
jgi:hypothetical protein